MSLRRMFGRRPGRRQAPEGGSLTLADASPETQAVIERVRPFTMTSPERIAALCNAVEYVVRCGIGGDFVECGVWRGGSSMAAALTLLRLGNPGVHLHLFDTFEGMSPPRPLDKAIPTGESAAALLARSDRQTGPVWAYAPIDDVESNLAGTGYPAYRIHFVAGRVEDTLPHHAPDRIALLRLDTDWYESTRHELIHLFPRLAVGGVLIIDDYGHWAGARQAVDEYLAEHKIRMLLNRIDYTGRIGVKLEPAP
jgi:O-methyltransferase